MLHCAAMTDLSPDASSQSCPGCGLLIDVSQEEPLAKVACPECGEKFRVERAFDNFALLETLGVGGMGSVYKARDTRLNRFVALKLLRPELSAGPAEIQRCEHEARPPAAVNDRDVVQVFSSGSDHGQFYLVMEPVDQGSLDDRMAEQGRVSEAQVLDTGIQVARGLRAAHEKGLIHRDVKPGNILFADEDTAKIGDFGLAVAAEQNAEAQNEIWGTPYYVAPERLNNEPEDFRSDLYSLGATLYHALAGRPPFEGETNSATALRDLKNNPLSLGVAAPDLRRDTVRVIDRMIAPDREQCLAGEAKDKQPLLNWIRLHRGLANLLRGYTTQARQAFEELEAGPFSTKPEEKAAGGFFPSNRPHHEYAGSSTCQCGNAAQLTPDAGSVRALPLRRG